MDQADHLDAGAANVALVRNAFKQYAQGDLRTIMDLLDPDIEWTYLDPSEVDPEPKVCRGRHELELALARRRSQGLHTELEEVVASGDMVVVTTRTPGIDLLRARQLDDRNIDVFTVRDGRIVAMRACRDRAEARAIAGV